MKDWIKLKTGNFNLVLETCTDAAEHGLIYSIVGYSGAGKTTALQHVEKEIKGAFQLRLDKTFRAIDMYVTMLRLVKVSDYGYDLPIRFLADRFSKEIKKRSYQTLMIIDDAGRFTADHMQHFQAIYDSCDRKLGMILSGTEQFEKEFKRWVIRNVKGIPELDSRIMDWVNLSRPTSHEIESIAQANGVGDKMEIERLRKVCTTFRLLYHEILKTRIKNNKKNKNNGN